MAAPNLRLNPRRHICVDALQHSPRGCCCFCHGPVPARRRNWCGAYCVNRFHALGQLRLPYGARCERCGAEGPETYTGRWQGRKSTLVQLEMEHILPVLYGGGCTGWWNRICLCKECHLKVRKKPLPPDQLPNVACWNYRHLGPARECRDETFTLHRLLQRLRRVAFCHEDYAKSPEDENRGRYLWWELEVLLDMLHMARTGKMVPLHTPQLVRWEEAGHHVMTWLHLKWRWELAIPKPG